MIMSLRVTVTTIGLQCTINEMHSGHPETISPLPETRLWRQKGWGRCLGPLSSQSLQPLPASQGWTWPLRGPRRPANTHRPVQRAPSHPQPCRHGTGTGTPAVGTCTQWRAPPETLPDGLWTVVLRKF